MPARPGHGNCTPCATRSLPERWGGWLLEVRPPAPQAAAAAAGLCLLLILDLVVEWGRRSALAVALLGVQVTLALAALRDAASLPLTGVVAALILGAPRVLPASWGRAAAGAVPAAAGLRTYTAVDPAAAVYVTAVLLAAGWLAVWVEETEEERRRHAETLEELERTQSRLVELAARTRDLAAERERQRILGEIHDTIGHTLTATLLQVQVARRLLAGDPAAAAERLAAVETTLRDALQEVRRSLRHAMHPDALPLATALQVLADDVMRAGGPRVEL